MTNSRALIALAILAGVVFLVIGGVYFATEAQSLPSFFPGHTGAGGSEAAHHHVKHGIASVVVAAGCFVFAWFQTGPKTSAA